MIPTKEKAITLLKEHLKEKANLDHCFLVGYGLQGLAGYFGENKDYWFVVGLLHDLDLECFEGDINKHTLVTEKILQENSVDQQLIDDIKSHNELMGIERNNKIRHSLYSLDGLTGIIRAYVLMRPDKDITKTETKSIIKKLKDKYFAVAVNRQQIYLCETTIGLPIEKFIEIILDEIKKNYKIE